MENYINHLNALYNNGGISRTQKQKNYNLFRIVLVFLPL